MEKTIIGITGLSGSGKSTLADNLNDLLRDSILLHIDKIHHEILYNNPNLLLETYGKEIFLEDGDFNHDVFIMYPEKIAKIHEVTHDMLVEAVLKKINESNNKYVILDFYALPKLKELWDLCNVTIFVSSDRKRREEEIGKRLVRNGRKPDAKLELRDSYAPDYNLFNYSYKIFNNYDDNYYNDIKNIAKELNNV